MATKTTDNGSIMEFAGAWSDMVDEDIESIKNIIALGRKETRLTDLYKKR